MIDSLTAATDDLKESSKNYVTVLSGLVRAEAADAATDAILRYYNTRVNDDETSDDILNAISMCADLAWESGR